MHVYLTPTGGEVVCTSVTDTSAPNPLFPDTKPLGKVSKWVRNERNPVIAMRPLGASGYGAMLAERRRRRK